MLDGQYRMATNGQSRWQPIQVSIQQYNLSRLDGSLRSIAQGNTNGGFGQCWRIIDAVAHHRSRRLFAQLFDLYQFLGRCLFCKKMGDAQCICHHGRLFLFVSTQNVGFYMFRFEGINASFGFWFEGIIEGKLGDLEAVFAQQQASTAIF